MHTPGPWRVKRIDYPRGMDVSFEVLAGREELVAQTIMREVGKGWRDDIIATDAANSKLISAAPDLLDALRECQAALAMMVSPNSIEQTTVANAFAAATAADVKARAAIAKAEGRQP